MQPGKCAVRREWWGGGSALEPGQWPDSLFIPTVLCTGPLFWFCWPGEGKKMSRAPCSAGHGQANTRPPWGRISALCCVQGSTHPCSNSTEVPRVRPCPCTAPGTLAATRLHSVCFLREMGDAEAEQVTSLWRGHPSPEQLPPHHNPNFPPASAKAAAFLGLQEE